ncbi:hypothetical protein RB653_003612 [Dictyostelium firmibasis]|uniref:Uncharacterized protein n=1 Tax=Dictyostelium firmibasis TaxID=79012 RepID=A0AAN7U9A9_9MYCE
MIIKNKILFFIILVNLICINKINGEVDTKIWKIRSEPIFNIPNNYGSELSNNEKLCFFNALKFINLYYILSQDNPISQYDNIDIISDALYIEKSQNISYYNIIVKFNDRFENSNIANFYVTCSTINISKINDILYQYAKHTVVEGLQSSFTYLKSFIEVSE